jgi:peptidoglycan/LPS O-acetylase OafA/YrhL
LATASGYRPDIDGLRALAVMSVVLYHLDTPGFGGGFGGVDVFFVISGFLIGGHIAEETAAGRFSLIGFYERRIRRIAPALLAMLALVLAAGAVILFPPDFRKLTTIARSVLELRANVRIAETFGDYTGVGAQTSPLLHTWSLAVEEQFYLVFPLLMLAIARFGRRRYLLCLTPLALISFFATVVAARIEPIKDFYLASFRAWELLLGAILAVGQLPAPTSARTRGIMALGGLLLIVLSDLVIKRGDPYPSEYALLACGGAALVLHARCGPGSIAGRLLGLPPVRAIGLWSYSLYLIHWPVLVFTHYYLDATLTPLQRAMVLAASLALAALSWRFVEQPFRGPGKLASTRGIYAGGAVAAGLMLCLCIGLDHSYGVLHPSTQALFQSFTPAQMDCWDIPVKTAAQRPLCRTGAKVAPTAVLWGDSHARALFPAASAAFSGHGQSAMLFAEGGCPPVLNMEVRRMDPGGGLAQVQAMPEPCPAHNAAALSWIAANRIRAVILAAHWIAYADRDKSPGALINHLTFVDINAPDLSEQAPSFERNFAATLSALQRLGVKTYVVEDDPQQDIQVPEALASDARLGRPRHHGIDRADYEAQQAIPTAIFERLQQRFGFVLIKPSDILCATGECVLERNGRSLYQDDEHLSPAGALEVAPTLSALWKPGFAGPG